MRKVTIAAIQPPAPGIETGIATDQVIARGLEWLEQAGERKADIAVLPEHFNALGLPPNHVRRAAEDVSDICGRTGDIARRHEMYVILPIIVRRPEGCLNRAILFDRSGRDIGCYDKVHPTLSEKRDYGVVPGNAIPTFETDFGRIGIMICYDVYFPEFARVLALNGAEAIFFPTLQRSEREEVCEAQVRMRAMDSFAYVARSSYGLPAGRPGAALGMPARSCIVRPDGTIIADAGREEGIALASIDLDRPWRRPRCHGEPPASVRDFILDDRRPELYRELGKKQPSAR